MSSASSRSRPTSGSRPGGGCGADLGAGASARNRSASCRVAGDGETPSSRRFGRSCPLLEQLEHALAMALAGLDCPLVVELLQQFSARELERPVVTYVYPLEVAQLHAVTLDCDRVADLTPQGPQRAAQAGASTLASTSGQNVVASSARDTGRPASAR
jgi:hypothetical protein